MIATLSAYDPKVATRFDAVIDVRSPAEFGIDHVPGAISLPVLSDAERAAVGTIYVQESRLKARRIGAALVARNIATHLEGPLADAPGSFHALIYCWRGGQRSRAMASVLDQVGWRVTVLAGGYRTYRRWITASLYDAAPVLRLITLDGGTGSAKTEILGRLADFGMQTLDLEAMAAHRGSLLGGLPGIPQPSQKLFESRLAAALAGFDPEEPIIVEAESSRIGEITLPPMLWKAMRAAPAIEIAAPPAERARYLACAYADLTVDIDALCGLIDRLPVHLAKDRKEAWKALARSGEAEALALALIEGHYDPSYGRARAAGGRRILAQISLSALDPCAISGAASRVAGEIGRWRDAA